MRSCHDLQVCTSTAEFKLNVMDVLRGVKRCHNQKVSYVDTTATLDIETTSTEDDGFAYSFQVNIAGVNAVFRYVEDLLDVLEFVCFYLYLDNRNLLQIHVHNLGFEFWHLIQILCTKWEITKALYVKPKRPLYVRLGCGLELRDSLRLFQKSLAGATKGCKHAKLSGDLDYTVYRTPDTPLTDDEFAYCVYDVQGLYEAIERLKSDRDFDAASLPLTNTSMVLGDLKDNIQGSKECYGRFKQIRLNKEQTRLAYKAMGGGDTHGCRWKAGRIFYNCNSVDFKSAHPSRMLLEKYPNKLVSYPQECSQEDMDILLDKGYGWIARVAISNLCVKPTCPNPTLSISKCDYVEGLEEVDNGRIVQAKAVLCYMDSNDWTRFKDCYDFDGMATVNTLVFTLAYLPKKFTDTVLGYFVKKENLSKYDPEYMFSKICINTLFGGCAQKSVRDEHEVIIDDTIQTSSTKWENNLNEMDDNAVLNAQKGRLPFLWGLWTSSLSRLELHKLLKLVGWDRVIYWDTDSCKYEGSKCGAIEDYNQAMKQKVIDRKMVITGKKGDVFIGVAEDECDEVDYYYEEFTFLHAKCYAAKAYHKGVYVVESTIAGVHKDKGAQALADDIGKLQDGFVIEDAGGISLKYINRPVFTRLDFSRPTLCASYVETSPRRYEVKTGSPEKVIVEEYENIAY